MRAIEEKMHKAVKEGRNFKCPGTSVVNGQVM